MRLGDCEERVRLGGCVEGVAYSYTESDRDDVVRSLTYLVF